MTYLLVFSTFYLVGDDRGQRSGRDAARSVKVKVAMGKAEECKPVKHPPQTASSPCPVYWLLHDDDCYEYYYYTSDTSTEWASLEYHPY